MDPSIERTADGDIVVHPLSQGLCPRYDSIAKLAVRVDAEPAIVAKADALREVLHRVLTDCAPPTLMILFLGRRFACLISSTVARFRKGIWTHFSGVVLYGKPGLSLPYCMNLLYPLGRWLLALSPQGPEEPSLIEFVKQKATMPDGSEPDSSLLTQEEPDEALVPESVDWRNLVAEVIRAPECKATRRKLEEGSTPRATFMTFCHLLTVVRVGVQNDLERRWDEVDAAGYGNIGSNGSPGSPEGRGMLTMSRAHLVMQQARLAFSDSELRRIFYGDGLRYGHTRVSLEEITLSYDEGSCIFPCSPSLPHPMLLTAPCLHLGIFARAKACAEINLELRQSLKFVCLPSTTTNGQWQPSPIPLWSSAAVAASPAS